VIDSSPTEASNYPTATTTNTNIIENSPKEFVNSFEKPFSPKNSLNDDIRVLT